MIEITLSELMQVKVHFGYSPSLWNPKMAPYIFTIRSGMHCIDLVKTLRLLKYSYNYSKKKYCFIYWNKKSRFDSHC